MSYCLQFDHDFSMTYVKEGYRKFYQYKSDEVQILTEAAYA